MLEGAMLERAMLEGAMLEGTMLGGAMLGGEQARSQRVGSGREAVATSENIETKLPQVPASTPPPASLARRIFFIDQTLQCCDQGHE